MVFAIAVLLRLKTKIKHARFRAQCLDPRTIAVHSEGLYNVVLFI